MHLPISLDDTLHFFQNLNKQVLMEDNQFLLLINVPIQNRAQQLQIYEVLHLPVLHSYLLAHSKLTTGT